jgi:hypothetical protein
VWVLTALDTRRRALLHTLSASPSLVVFPHLEARRRRVQCPHVSSFRPSSVELILCRGLIDDSPNSRKLTDQAQKKAVEEQHEDSQGRGMCQV